MSGISAQQLRRCIRNAARLSSALIILLGAHGIAVAQELDGLHFEPMVLFEGISGDGSSLLVRRPDSSSLRSLATGAEQTIIEGVPAVPTALSGDGSTAIGYLLPRGESREAFRWTSEGGFERLGAVSGGRSRAYGVNRDGSVIVGDSDYSFYGIRVSRAFRWVEGSGMAYIPFLNARSFSSIAYAVSDDGRSVVGIDASRGNEAYLWSRATGTVGLGHLPGGGISSGARGISGNGQVVVGSSDYGNRFREQAFRWTREDGMVGLGFLPGGEESVASIANNDGSIIYGTSGTTDPGGRSFRWTADTGMVSMASLLARNGVDIGDVNLWQVTGASDDGKVVVGWGYDAGFTTPHGWIASCAAVCQGIVRQDDLNRSLADLASITRTSTTYADASLGSAAEALDNAAETRASRRGPVTMFGYGLYDSDPVLAAQLGFTLDLPHDMVAGAALGVGRLTTEMAFDGHSDFDVGEALVFLGQSEKFGIDWLLAGTAHRFEGDVQRGYRNGTVIAASHGSTEGHGYGVMARLGWNVPGPVEGMRFRPYGSLSHTTVDVDGWTETTGPLPLSIDGFSDKATSARLGVDARWNVDARTTLWSGIAWGHRFGGGNPRITGHLGSSFTASAVGNGSGSDWIDLNAGARFSVTESLFATVSATAAVPFDGDATFRGRVGFIKSF